MQHGGHSNAWSVFLSWSATISLLLPDSLFISGDDKEKSTMIAVECIQGSSRLCVQHWPAVAPLHYKRPLCPFKRFIELI